MSINKTFIKKDGQCPHCHAELIFEPKDLTTKFIACPTCFKNFRLDQAIIKIGTDGSRYANSNKYLIKNKYLGYFLALVACGLEIIVYAIIGALLGWENGGGVLLMIVLFGLLIITWRKIVGMIS